MEKDFDFINNTYTGTSVIERGYEIYDEWTVNRFSSRKVVNCIEHAVFLSQSKKTISACSEALSCLFALDIRIKERYNTIFRCLFLYFSWRRETGALKRHKNILHITESTDIRTAIEIELKRLREKFEGEESHDGDDETHGGKRNGKDGEEAATAEHKENEQALEKNTDKVKDEKSGEETSEEKAEDVSEKAPAEETAKTGDERQQSAETSHEDPKPTARNEEKPVNREEQNEHKEELNGSEEEAEPSKDKSNEALTYNYAVDVPPLHEETVSERSDDKKLSFIDEMILDSMVKGDKNIIGYQRTDEAERLKEADIPVDTVTNRNEKSKSTDKDAYLYDKMIATDKGEDQQTLNPEPTKQAEKVSETKIEQPKETIQNNDKVKSNEQEIKPLSEMLKADLNESIENQIIKELGNTMSDESRVAFAQMQMDIAREKLSITYDELGIDEPAEIIGMYEPAQASQQSISSQRK